MCNRGFVLALGSETCIFVPRHDIRIHVVTDNEYISFLLVADAALV